MELNRNNNVFALKFFICQLIMSEKDTTRKKKPCTNLFMSLMLLQNFAIEFNVAAILKMCGNFIAEFICKYSFKF